MSARISCCLWMFPISDRDPDCMEKFAYTDTETLLWDYSDTEEHYVLAIPPARKVRTLYRVTQVYAYQWFGINGGNNLKIIYYPFAQTHFRNLGNPCDCPPEVDAYTASVAVAPSAVFEDGGIPLVFTITLDRVSADSSTINFTLTGTATEGVDYPNVSPHLVTIAAGQLSAQVSITPIPDLLTEADETIILTLTSGVSGAGLINVSGGVATGTLIQILSCPNPGIGFATIVNADGACLLNADNNCMTAATVTWLPWPALTYDPTTAVSTTLSNGNLTASNQLAYWRGVRSTTTQSSGKWYFEVTFVKSNNAIFNQAGMAITPTSVTNWEDAVEVNGVVLFANDGGITLNGGSFGTALKSFSNTATGDVYGVAVDLTNNKAWFRIVGGPNINLSWNGSGAANPATNVGGASIAGGSTCIWGACNFYADNDTTEAWTANFGGSAFTGTAPAGFSAWGNTATWDPATNLSMALSGGNLIATNTTSDPQNQGVRVATALAQSVGRYYFESTLDVAIISNGGLSGGPGIALTTATYPELFNFATNGASVNLTGGNIFSNGDQVGFIGSQSTGDTIGIAVDLYNHKIWFKIVAGPSSPGAFWNGDPHANPAINKNGVDIVSGSIVPVAYFGANKYPGSSVITVNFNPAIIPIS